MKVTTDSCLFGAVIAQKIENEKIESLLDIGCGTGLLSLMIAQKNPDLKIDAIEIDEDAGLQAIENINNSRWKDQISVVNSDVRVFSFSKKYDCIISNPPFYENELQSPDNKRNLAHHGQELQLQQLLAIINKRLNPAGRFYLLLPYKRYEEIRELSQKQGLAIGELIFIRQSTGHDHFRIILSGKQRSMNSGEIELNEIAIRGENNNYTDEFISLLKDYYLQL
jgi:tRNA1Val (adenine37-N6)-methyltransferase